MLNHIHPGFMGKLPTLSLWNQDVRITLFLEFEHHVDSVLMDSVGTPELDASFDEADDVLFSLFKLSTLSIISDNSRLQVVPIIKSHQLWFQAGALLLPVP